MDEEKVLIETHPDWSMTANSIPLRTAFQAELIKKANSLRHYKPNHHIGNIVFIQQTQFKITGIAFYSTYIQYQLFALINDTVSQDWYTEDFFTTAPGPTIWSKV